MAEANDTNTILSENTPSSIPTAGEEIHTNNKKQGNTNRCKNRGGGGQKKYRPNNFKGDIPEVGEIIGTKTEIHKYTFKCFRRK